MSGLSDLRRGWCPSALRPMESGDGLIVRVRPRGGELAADQVRALADAACACGNGVVELTRRAGLQLRGVSTATLSELRGILHRLGLLDESPDAEIRRNILCNPLAGIDPDCSGIHPILRALENRLAQVEACNRLPAKFGFVIDGGGCLPLREEDGDIRFDVVSDTRVRVGVGGNAVTASRLGWCHANDVAEVAARLVSAFVEHRTAHAYRLRTFLSTVGTASLSSALFPLLNEDRGDLMETVGRAEFIGLGTLRGEDMWFGAALPFGSGPSAQWAGLAALSERWGDGRVRITPWRSVILLPKTRGDTKGLAQGARELGLLTEPDDPRRFLVACSGAPLCRSAQGTTRDIARSIAAAAPALIDGSICIHVSGCIKGCARSAPAEIMLTAQDGKYRLGLATTADRIDAADLLTSDRVLERLSALADEFARRPADESAATFLARKAHYEPGVP